MICLKDYGKFVLWICSAMYIFKLQVVNHGLYIGGAVIQLSYYTSPRFYWSRCGENEIYGDEKRTAGVGKGLRRTGLGGNAPSAVAGVVPLPCAVAQWVTIWLSAGSYGPSSS